MNTFIPITFIFKYNFENSSCASRSSLQLRRFCEDEHAIYKIDVVDVENAAMLSCSQRTRSFFKTYTSVLQNCI